MADKRARDAERRARISDDTGDRAAALRARLQAGDLSPDRLALAAFLGDPAAASLVPADDPALVAAWAAAPPNAQLVCRSLPTARTKLELADALLLLRKRWPDREALVRIALAAARSVLPVWERRPPVAGRSQDDPARELAAVEAWLKAAPDERAPVVRCADGVAPASAQHAARSARVSARMAAGLTDVGHSFSLNCFGAAVAAATEAQVGQKLDLDDGLGAGVAVLAAVRDEVVPWLLDGSSLAAT